MPRTPTARGVSPRRAVGSGQGSRGAGAAEADEPFDLDNLSNINGKDAM